MLPCHLYFLPLGLFILGTWKEMEDTGALDSKDKENKLFSLPLKVCVKKYTHRPYLCHSSPWVFKFLPEM